MVIKTIKLQNTPYTNELTKKLLNNHPSIEPLINRPFELNQFRDQIIEKSHHFSQEKRDRLSEVLTNQYQPIDQNTFTLKQITSLKSKNTFCITTGHQLNLFTGPLYFFYKIIHIIKLSELLNDTFKEYHFVPIFWMASEDHDFEEINHFNYKNQQLKWQTNQSGMVGEYSLENLKSLSQELKTLFGSQLKENQLLELFNNAYLKNKNLTQATRQLVHRIFQTKGLVIIDGNDHLLKKAFIPLIEKELLHQSIKNKVTKTIQYAIKKPQVSPRDINLFYTKKSTRERIVKSNKGFRVLNTSIEFSEKELLKHLQQYPERFSPNVLLRPIYQEFTLPNLVYIGGQGELNYWLELKSSFKDFQVVFPLIKLRHSVLFISEQNLKKITKNQIIIEDLLNNNLEEIIKKTIKLQSKLNIDFSPEINHLKHQFNRLKDLANQTDKSFLGAVNAQEKKQINGLLKLEKRLLKAEKRRNSQLVNQLKKYHLLFYPNNTAQERFYNFSQIISLFGWQPIESLFNWFNPLESNLYIISLK